MRNRVIKRGKGADLFGWGTAYGTGKGGAQQAPAAPAAPAPATGTGGGQSS